MALSGWRQKAEFPLKNQDQPFQTGHTRKENTPGGADLMIAVAHLPNLQLCFIFHHFPQCLGTVYVHGCFRKKKKAAVVDLLGHHRHGDQF